MLVIWPRSRTLIEDMLTSIQRVRVRTPGLLLAVHLGQLELFCRTLIEMAKFPPHIPYLVTNKTVFSQHFVDAFFVLLCIIQEINLNNTP